MHNLLETEYNEAIKLPSTISSNSINGDNNRDIVRSTVRSKLDADFDDEEEDDIDELQRYILEQPANKDIDVLAWWKVIHLH